MKWLVGVVWLSLAALGATLQAQDEGATGARGTSEGGTIHTSMGVLEPTPEMWFYEQEIRRHDDPRQAVRRRAEFRADQRQRRLAARRWFGISNSRPTANPTPLTSYYSHSWAGSLYSPFLWPGATRPATVVVERYSGLGLW